MADTNITLRGVMNKDNKNLESNVTSNAELNEIYKDFWDKETKFVNELLACTSDPLELIKRLDAASKYEAEQMGKEEKNAIKPKMAHITLLNISHPNMKPLELVKLADKDVIKDMSGKTFQNILSNLRNLKP